MAVSSEGNNVPDQIDRSQPPADAGVDNPAGVKANITWWQDRVLSARKFHAPAFKIIDEDSQFASGLQWPGQTSVEDERYVVNIVQSEIAASVATLYAKNPTFTAKRRPRMDYAVWDEDPKTYEEALTAVQQALQVAATTPPTQVMGLDGMTMTIPVEPQIPPDAKAIIDDVQQAEIYRKKMDRMARTLELLITQQIDQQQPSFKAEMKQLVCRSETNYVGYIKLGYRRINQVSPETQSRLNDLTTRLQQLEASYDCIEEGRIGDYNREREDLRIQIKTLQEAPVVITKQGLTVNFPRATALIIDPACTQIKGFVGARWLAEEYNLTASQIQAIYKKDVKSKATAYQRSMLTGEGAWAPNRKREPGSACDWDDTFRVWEIYNVDNGSVMTICEGFDEYLVEPSAPDVVVEQFYPYYPLILNMQENSRSLYGNSTCRLIRHQQQEVNRQKEALRQHRINSKPQYAAVQGSMTETDRNNMEAAPAFAVIELQALEPGQGIEQLLQQIKKHPIDPNMYDSNSTISDIRLITRRSDARLGGVSKASATADAIAEDSRIGEDKSKADDIDELLSAFTRDAGIVLMMNMTVEEVRKIVGPGAVWPEGDITDYIQDLYLDVRAGSTGKPNQALEVASFQRLFPLLVQTPGIRPDWLARKGIALSDSSIDFTEAFLDGLPSITAMNAMMTKQMAAPQPGTGNPATDPASQGAQGANPTPQPPGQDQSMTVNNGKNDIAPVAPGENPIVMQ